MAGKDQYKASDFIEAIDDSGGIITVIAKRVGCTWNTAKRYIEDYSTVKIAYDAECEKTTDDAQSILLNNFKAAKNIQELALNNENWAKAIVDTADAKWWLSRKGQGRGFSDKQEIQLKVSELEKLSDDELRAIAES